MTGQITNDIQEEDISAPELTEQQHELSDIPKIEKADGFADNGTDLPEEAGEDTYSAQLAEMTDAERKLHDESGGAWFPKKFFKGDDESFTPGKQFIKIRKQQEQIKEFSDKLLGITQKISKYEEAQEKARERKREEEYKEAFAVGDTEAFEKLREEEKKSSTVSSADPLKEFEKERIYMSDAESADRKKIDTYFTHLDKHYSHLSDLEMARKLEDYEEKEQIGKHRPEKRSNTNYARNRPPSTASAISGVNRSDIQTKQESYAKLPASFRNDPVNVEVYNNLVKVFGSDEAAKRQIVKSYNAGIS